MIDSLYIGATGMQAQQLHVDVIANNLANVNTAGFKKNRISFEDTFYRAAASLTGPNDPTIDRVMLGMGTIVSALGVWLSLQLDLPTGATIVCTFGLVLILMAAARPVFRLKSRRDVVRT